jgi:hypothetical protein
VRGNWALERDAAMMDDIDARYYVYLFRNPIDKNIFYIGKGTGPRAGNLNNRNDKTLKTIEKIRAEGNEPEIEILRDGLDDETAQMYEGVAIDVIGIDNLTNLKVGRGSNHSSKTLTKMRSEELSIYIDPDEANITERAILIRINQLYRYGMDADSLYDATRGVWVIGGKNAGGRRDCAKYAFSVFKGIIIEVYKINQWYLAGTQATYYKTRPDCNEIFICDPPRWEFEGEIAESDIRGKYLNKSVKNYLTTNSQNPIKYVNCQKYK